MPLPGAHREKVDNARVTSHVSTVTRNGPFLTQRHVPRRLRDASVELCSSAVASASQPLLPIALSAQSQRGTSDTLIRRHRREGKKTTTAETDGSACRDETTLVELRSSAEHRRTEARLHGQRRAKQNRAEQSRTEQSRHSIRRDTTRHHSQRAPTGDVQRDERAVLPQCSGEGLTRRRPHVIVCAIASDAHRHSTTHSVE
jgi:hypothetical protein